ncbi:MAG: thioredoxin-disulfide reductase [Bacteroidales bacterium]
MINANSNDVHNVGAFTLYDNNNIHYHNLLLKHNKGLFRSAFGVSKSNNARFTCIDIVENTGGASGMSAIGPDSALILYSADTVYFENCRFHNNLPDYDTTSGSGSGLIVSGLDFYPDSLTTYILNCEFSENVMNYEDGPGSSALGVYKGAKVFVSNSTIGNNTKTGELGASVGVSNNSELNIYNSIIFGNQPAQFFMINDIAGMESDLNIYHSLVQDGMFGIKVYSPGNHIHYDDSNIDDDPLWHTAGIFPYMLTAASPCINAGTLELPAHIHLPDTDLAGNPRLYNGQIDMGAYEYGPWVGINPYLQKPEALPLFARPNPFHHETTIQYQSREKGRHSIFVYDINGKRLTTLTEYTGLPGKGRFSRHASAIWHAFRPQRIEDPISLTIFAKNAWKMSETEKTKCLIIGSGPAGYTAAIYAARADLKPIVYEGLQPGGQLTTTTDVDNFPGYPDGITGPEMMEDMKKQAQRFDTDVRMGMINEIDLSKHPFTAKADDGKTLEADSVIIATGATAKWLGLESEARYNGYGVSACATCDGFFYKGKDVAIIGGGDTAAEEATYLAKLCKKVYLVHRRDELRASKAMQKKVFNTPNIEIIWDHVTREIVGKEAGFSKAVTGAILENVKTGEEKKIDIDGFFVAIGHKPNTDIFRGQLETDEQGYIQTAPNSTRTNIEGVFACGDVQDHVFRQAVTAAGTGCMAAIEAERYLSS